MHFANAEIDLSHNVLIFQARPLLNHALDSQDFKRLVDPRLERKYVESEVLRMIGIAAACVRHASAKRPQMGQVVFLLSIHNTNMKTQNPPLLHLVNRIVLILRLLELLIV